MKRQNPNDTINILDSLHSLDTEGDRTKDEERLQRFFVAELMRKIRPGFIVLFMKDVEGNKACGLTPAVTRGNIPARAASKLKATAERASRKFRIRSYPNGEAGLRRAGVRNALVVPLGTHKAEGVFVLGNKEGGFSDSDRRLADEIESAADSILEHARDYNQLQQRKNELEVLYKIDRIRDSSDSFDEMIDRVHSELVKITDARRGFIVLYDMLGRMKALKLQPPALKDESASPPAAPGPAPDKKTILNICRTACSHGQLVCRNEAKYRTSKTGWRFP